MTTRILCGDSREMLATLPDGSVQTCVTSPPYFGLRDYGHAGQIGLEATVDEYVTALVDVFREVRRVLADDGTLWLNLGDSYAANRPGGQPAPTNTGNRQGYLSSGLQGVMKVPEGLKPKDLIGIPWRVARALQEPYYTGRIKRVEDRVWLAAMIDAEGCMFIHKRKAGQHNGQGYYRKNDSYGSGLEVANTSEAIVQRCMEITGCGSVCRQDKDRRQPLFRWNLRSNECREIVREVYPYLVAKRQQARLLIGCPPSGAKAEAAHAAMILLHNGSETTVDFPDPASMFEQGYYLRQDIIWSKSNPMPESVRDRCTKAHEYLFLMSKAPRYYYDAEAIAEPVTASTIERLSQPTLDTQAGSDRVPGKTNGAMKAVGEMDTRNKRSVWTVTTQPFSEAHFATFPPKLIEPCILAGSRPGDTVLDPFGGAGTTGLVADRLGRDSILIELNPDYAEIARRRITNDAPMFASVEIA